MKARTNEILPPLPPVDGYDVRPQGHYSAEQMHAYAIAALEASLSSLPKPADVGKAGLSDLPCDALAEGDFRWPDDAQAYQK